MEVAALKLGGTNEVRKGVMKIKGGAVSITASSFANISIDPLAEELLFESSGTTFSLQGLSMTNIKEANVRAEGGTSSQLWKINHKSISVGGSAEGDGVTLDTLEVTSGMELTAAERTDISALTVTSGEAENLFLNDLLKINSPELAITDLQLDKTKLRKGAVTASGANVFLKNPKITNISVDPIGIETLI